MFVQISLSEVYNRQCLLFREAPLWNVLVLYGHCPNSFRPPAPLLSNRQTWKKVLQTIPASPYTLGQTWEKSDPNHPGKPFHPPSPPFQAMPIWKQHISKRGFPLQWKKQKRHIVRHWLTLALCQYQSSSNTFMVFFFLIGIYLDIKIRLKNYPFSDNWIC